MDPKTLANHKKMLLEEKQRLLNNSRRSKEEDIKVDQNELSDESDQVATDLHQNVVFQLRDKERIRLAMIEEALAKIEEGTYGVCEDCEEMIEPKRLEAAPFSTKCLSCKEAEEKEEKYRYRTG